MNPIKLSYPNVLTVSGIIKHEASSSLISLIPTTGSPFHTA